MSKQYIPKRFQLSLKISMTAIIIITAAIVGLSIQVPWFIFSRNKTVQLFNQINSEILDSVTRETEGFFSRAVDVQRGIRDIFTEGVVDINDIEQRKQYYMYTLRHNDNFSWVSYGWPNGDFFGTQRGADNKILFYERDWRPALQNTREIIEEYESATADSMLDFTLRREQERVYDVTQRSWYRRAVNTDTDIITPVYIFSASRQPGVNTAIKITDEAGDVTGVISIAMELSSLSSFIADLNISENGVAFIIDQSLRLIAFRDVEELSNVGDDDRLNLRTIDQANSPLLQKVYNSIVQSDIDLINQQDAIELSYTDNETNDSFFTALRPLDRVNELSDFRWYVGTIIPESDFVADIRRNTLILVLLIGAIIVICLIAILLFTQKTIVRPVQDIVDQSVYIRNLELDKVKPPTSPIREIYLLADSISRMTRGLTSFQRYVPTELVQQLILQGREARLGSENKDMTIFFSDIAHFTRISEILGTQIALYLTSYFNGMSDVIADEEGIIDKYIGDAIMAFWGAPVLHADHAVRACRAALRCQQFLRSQRRESSKRGEELLFCRIGINSGKVLVGNFGWQQRMDYTVLGDAVNVASRLEMLNKQYGTSILLGQKTYEAAKSEIVCRRLDKVQVYGKTQGEDIYELLAMKSNIDMVDCEWVPHFEEGLQYYQRRDWVKAVSSFKESYLASDRKDLPSVLFIKRCKLLSKQTLPDNWDGTFAARHK